MITTTRHEPRSWARLPVLVMVDVFGHHSGAECRQNGNTFAETISQPSKANQPLLSRQIPKSDSSNCSKLELHAPERGGDQMSEETEKWMKLSDVAAEAQMALSTIYYLHNKGRGPKFSRLGRTVRVKRSDFDAWFEENREN